MSTGGRKREDDKNEKIIRALQKLPANKNCINCNALGPQYVCTNFWTFICTNCSGIHREFTHRVKSVSMSTFTSNEVSALQEGGNERAKKIYFSTWDPQRDSFPDSSNIDRLRDFIKRVYMDRKYIGQGSNETSRLKIGEENSLKNKERLYHGQSVNQRHHDGDKQPDGGTSKPDNDEFNRSSERVTVLQDKSIEGAHGEVPTQDGGRVLGVGTSSFSATPSIGSAIAPPKIPEPPTPRSKKNESPNIMLQTQGSATTSSKEDSSTVSTVVAKPSTLGSLIDFDSDINPSRVKEPQPETPKNTSFLGQDAGWASFDAPIPHVTSSTGKSTREAAQGHQSSFGQVQQGNILTVPTADTYATMSSHGGHQQFTTRPFAAHHGGQPHQFFNIPFAAPANQPVVGHELMEPSFGSSNLVNNVAPASNVFHSIPHQMAVLPTRQPPASESTTSRKALPEGLFAASYVPYSNPTPGWGPISTMGVGHPMQYPSQNFLSLVPLHGALPNNAMASSHVSGIESHISQQMPPQHPVHPLAASLNPYMVQQHASAMPQLLPSSGYQIQHQAYQGLGNRAGQYISPAMDQYSAARSTRAGGPHFFPSAGHQGFQGGESQLGQSARPSQILPGNPHSIPPRGQNPFA